MTLLPFILVIVGLLLIVTEFYVPGVIMGISGGILIVISIIIFATQDHSAIELAAFIIAVIFSLGFLISFTIKRIPKAKKGMSIYLGTDQEGYQVATFDTKLIGKKGKVLSDLKPSGHVLIETQQYQAISQSGYIVKGSEIIVIDGRGAYLVVKEKS